MTLILLALGVLFAIVIIAASFRTSIRSVRIGGAVLAAFVLFVFTALSSIRYVGEDEVGVVVRNFGKDLPSGQIIATAGEKGPQAEILGPGWHFWLWPGVVDIEISPLTRIEAGQVGLLTTTDGLPLPPGEIYAPEWSEAEFQNMLKADHFLTTGRGYKGPQASVLTPGKYRINPKLFRVEMVPVTNVPPATVAVIKSNVGVVPPSRAIEESDATDESVVPDDVEQLDAADLQSLHRSRAARLVDETQRGIRRTPLSEGEYYLNSDAYEVTLISTRETIIEFTEDRSTGMNRSITVRTSDGFEFPVDVRVMYQIEPANAPLVVATLRDDKDGLMNVLLSAVRSIFRNNAQNVKALDYVQQRVEQEKRSTEKLAEEMAIYGITISAVRIADLGDDSERWQSLLKTQTDREIALQEQLTFQEQQRAAEQKKALTRTEQEAEEERELARATYAVDIADQEKKQRIIEAEAEAESIRIRAEAQAKAYMVIAEQIGQGNAALIELLKIVGERNINITPRVMVIGGEGAASGSAAKDAETTALIGTMLDSMLKEEPKPGG